MTGRERILTALQRKQPDCVPTFEWFIDESVGKTLTGHTDPIAIVDALDLDGINIRPNYRRQFITSDTFTDEWGATRQLTNDSIPATLTSPIADISQHTEYTFPDPAAPHRFKTLEAALAQFGRQRAVVLNLRDGWSDMRDLLGYENCLVSFIAEPDLFRALLNRVVDFNIALARVAKERYGIEIISTTDDVANATGLLVDPDQYLEVVGPGFTKTIRGFKALGLFCIKHCDGDPSPILPCWIDAGIDCLDPIDPQAGLRMDDFRKQYGHRICLKGNIDCVDLLCTGSETEVRQAVKDCIDQSGRAGLIVSSSNTIHRGVRPANYRAMLDAIREFGRQQ